MKKFLLTLLAALIPVCAYPENAVLDLGTSPALIALGSNSLSVGTAGSGKLRLMNNDLVMQEFDGAGGTTWYADGDANRKLAFDASSDTALTMKFGDGTASQVSAIFNTADTDRLDIGGGSAANSSNGGLIQIYGAGNTGQILITSATQAGADINLRPIDDLIFTLSQDANRLITFDSSSDTNLELNFGDGTTAGQNFVITSASADAADSGRLFLSGGGAYDAAGTRGAGILLNGSQQGSTPSDLVLVGGSEGGGSAGQIAFYPGGSNYWTMSNTGTLIGAGTSTIGWSVVAAVGATCTATCTTPCVFGQATADQLIVSCATSITGNCLCAGGS